MRVLWNTFNAQAAWLATALAVVTSVYVGAGLQAGYRHSAWWSAVLHGPMFAFGLYLYLAVAFNLARVVRSGKQVFALAAWLFLGAVIPCFVGYGLVLLLTVIGVAIPVLSYLPLGLGTIEVAIHITWLGLLAALAIAGLMAAQALRGRTQVREPSDA